MSPSAGRARTRAPVVAGSTRHADGTCRQNTVRIEIYKTVKLCDVTSINKRWMRHISQHPFRLLHIHILSSELISRQALCTNSADQFAPSPPPPLPLTLTHHSRFSFRTRAIYASKNIVYKPSRPQPNAGSHIECEWKNAQKELTTSNWSNKMVL